MTGRTLIAALFLLLLALPARAQDWPNRPVVIVYPFAAGGGADAMMHGLAQALSAKFGQPFAVENRTGAGGALGSVYVAKAAPDGYTLLMTAIGPAVLNQLLFKSVAYDTDKDFAPVILFGEIPQLIIASPKLGFKSLGELVDFGKNNPGKLNIGHAGAGSMGHLTAALFLARTGIKGTLVAYRGAVPVVLDVIGGQIQAGVPVYVPPARKATILAVTSDQRISFLPEVPTAREGGVDLIASTWIAIMAPAGTPPAVIDRLNAAINEFISSPDGQRQFTTAGIRPLGGTPGHLADVIKQDRALWAPVIEKEHITLEPK